ncbi:MAG: aldo/keto reductase [Treponema sp.]|nr:aldo/keto reductase [Treponema sp.]
MEYTTFGKTGRKVSRIGFGGAVAGLKNYLEKYDPSDDATFKGVVEAIQKAYDLGITYFDTAASYGNRKKADGPTDRMSEKIYGEGLKGVKPETIFLATKFSGLSRDEVYRSVEESLKCLRRDYVDLLQIHGSSYTNEELGRILGPGGTLEAMEELKRQGVTRYIGFTTEDNNDNMYRLIQSGRFDTIQMCYNFIFQHGYEPSRPFGSMLEAEKYGLGIATMRTTTSGTFQRWIQMVNPENRFDYSRALIQFVLSNPYVDVALVGMRTKELVIDNVKIADDFKGRIKLDEVHRRYV